jgi:hypothetical protein
MGKMVVSVCGLAGLLWVVSVGFGQAPDALMGKKAAGPGQNPGASKSGAAGKSARDGGASLEQLIARAVQDNPDIRVAEAKVREAEAELNRTRLLVTQKIITLTQSLEAQKGVVLNGQEHLDALRRGFEVGRVPAETLTTAEGTLLQEKSKFATLEAELPALLGTIPRGLTKNASSRWQSLGLVSPPSDFVSSVAFTPDGQVLATVADGTVRVWDAKTGKQLQLSRTSGEVVSANSALGGTMAERIRKALDTPIRVSFSKTPLAEVLATLQQSVPVPITFVSKIPPQPQMVVTLQLTDSLPLGAVLEAIADALDLEFAVRDYGILVRDNGGFRLPEGAISLHGFWKGSAQPSGLITARKAPKADIEGTINMVRTTGLVSLDIGSDAGLHVGSQLQVYRLTPEPKFLGTLEVVTVKNSEAVAKRLSATGGDLHAGDRIAGSLEGGRR